MLTKTSIRLFVFACFLAGLFVSFRVANIERESMRFDKYDYAFYLQFATKLFDGRIEKVYSVNPGGENCLFLGGIEGTDSFHQTIHFEPIKYLYAVLYFFFGTPKILFLFISLVFFFPSLYAAFAIPMPTEQRMYMVLFISVLYILYPAAVFVPSYDLRPYIFLAPFFLLSFLSITFARPSWEIVLWFNVLFLAREEAIILAAVLLIYAFVHFRGGKPRLIAALCVSWLFWLGVILLFMYWCGYPIKVVSPPGKFHTLKTALFLAAAILVCMMGIAAMLCRRWLRAKLSSQKALEIVSFSTIFLPLAYMFGKKEISGIISPTLNWLESLLFSPRYFLYFVALLCLNIIFWQNAQRKVHEKTRIALFFVIGLLFFSIHIVSSHGVFQSLTRDEKERESTEKIWKIRDITDKYASTILADQYVYQAFADYRYIYVYDALPWHIVQGEGRSYPANRAIVQNFVDERIDYIVGNVSNYDLMKGFLAHKNLVGIDLFKDRHFFAVQIKR